MTLLWYVGMAGPCTGSVLTMHHIIMVVAMVQYFVLGQEKNATQGSGKSNARLVVNG
jgi:hypothetical protein